MDLAGDGNGASAPPLGTGCRSSISGTLIPSETVRVEQPPLFSLTKDQRTHHPNGYASRLAREAIHRSWRSIGESRRERESSSTITSRAIESRSTNAGEEVLRRAQRRHRVIMASA
jgi:hypothetical protein